MIFKKLNPMGNPNFIRKTFKKGDDVRDAGLTTPDEIERFDQIQYGNDPIWNTLDVYRRKDMAKTSEEPQPTIVSIHGGGWVYGDKELYQYYCMDLAMRGFTVVNFSYRLAPEHRFPAPIEDTNAVFTWIADHCKEYRIDPHKLFVVGDSAGAQLASQYLALLTNPAYQKVLPLSPSYPSDRVTVRAVALNCGVYEGEDIIHQAIADSYFPGKPANYLEQVDTLRYITDAFPAAYVMTSFHDFLRAKAAPMHRYLRSKGVTSVYRLYGRKEQKEMGHVFHLNIRLPQAKECNDDECAFFRKFL